MMSVMTLETLSTSAYLGNDEFAWRAVQARDVRADGSFVYGVRSTCVYCRPSCPSRRPLRKNAVFFASARDAELAGYRECRRCRPSSSQALGALATANKVRAYLDSHLDEPVTLREMGRALGMSAFHLQRTFKKLTGVSPKAYADARRAERFKELLKARRRVTDAVYDAGFGAPSRAYETSRSRLGMTPFTYARGGRGMHIRYIIAKTPFGLILVATTERGICRVATASTREALRKELAKEFPKATLEQADAELKPWVSQILDHIAGADGELLLPLDLRATAFQRRVWEALRKIPYGETRSYSEIARSIGAPKAVRAVGGACGQNPVALVIPCHRVIREDGELGGFGWGIDVKRRLLEREKAGALARSRRMRQKAQVQGAPKELR